MGRSKLIRDSLANDRSLEFTLDFSASFLPSPAPFAVNMGGLFDMLENGEYSLIIKQSRDPDKDLGVPLVCQLRKKGSYLVKLR